METISVSVVCYTWKIRNLCPAQPDVSINRQEEQFQKAVLKDEQANRSHSFTLNDLADIALLQS